MATRYFNEKMKKLLPAFVLIFTAVSFAQIAKPTPEKEQSKLEQFSAKSGGLFERRFEPVGTVKGVKVEILSIADLISGLKIMGLRFEYYAYASYGGDTKTAFLDADEVDGLIKSITMLQSTVFPSTRDVYTEVTYTSRGGFSAGAYYANKQWTAFVKLEKYDSRSQVTMKPEDFGELLTFLQQAKAKLK